MIPLADARTTVLGGMTALSVVEVPLAEAAGCVLAGPVVAADGVPAFANSAMDGYALRAADATAVPAILSVVGTILAGQRADVAVGPGQAVRIMTGAPMPPGADCVCMVEHTSPGEGDTVVIEEVMTVGASVRYPGEDVAEGDEVFDAGTALTPAHVGVLASLGCDPVRVHRRPTVAVLSTGDELAAAGAPLGPGQIRDSNRPGLLAALAADGFLAVDLGVLPDDPGAVHRGFAEAVTGYDAVVTSGGVSVGDRDVIRMVLQDLGGPDVRWMQVAIKPAKPLAFGRLGERRVPVFGLPGNPVSALVSYELFVRPALRAMAGHHRLDRPVVRATVAEPLVRRPDGKIHFMRVSVAVAADGALTVRPADGQASHQLRAMADANALAVLPDGDGAAAGASVGVMLLDAAAVMPDDGVPVGPGDLVPAW